MNFTHLFAAIGLACISFISTAAEPEDRAAGTIPGSHHIVYTEVFAFCNGPVCPQSPMAIQAMTRDDF